MADSDEGALVLQFTADIRALEAQMTRMNRVLDKSAGDAEKRTKAMATNMNKALGEFNPGEALEKTFSRARFAVFEEGGAKVGIFGKALEALGPAGLGAAAGLAATALAVEAVSKAAEQIGDLALSSKRLGIPVEDLERWQFLAAASHVTTQQLDQALEGLSNTLGKLQSGIRDARVKPFLDELKISDGDLGKLQNAGQLMDLLIQRMSALHLSAGERVQIVEAFGGEAALNLLSRTSDEVKGLTADYKANASVISGDQAEAIEKLNTKYDEAHAILDSKIKKDLVDLVPLLRNVQIGWESIAAAAVGAIDTMMHAKDAFDQQSRNLANAKPDPEAGPIGVAASWGKNLVGRASWAVTHPISSMLTLAGPGPNGGLAGLGEPDNILGFRTPAPAAGAAKGDSKADAPASTTGAALEKARKATEDFDKALAEYVTHTSHAAEMQKRIANDRANGAVISSGQEAQLMASARAQDAKPENRAASEAARKKAEAARKAAELAQKALDEVDKSQEAIDAATAEELGARKELATNIQDQATIEAAVLKATRDRALAQLKTRADKKEISPQAATAAGSLIDTAYNERAQRNANVLSDQLAKQSADMQRQELDGQIEMVQAQDVLATTTQQRKANALKLLDLQEQLEEISLQEIINSKIASDAEKELAEKKLEDLRRTYPVKQAGTAQQNGSPGQDFAKQMNSGSLSDDLQNTEAGAIKNMGDNLSDVIMKTKSVKQAFHDMAQSIVSDLLKIAIQREVEAPLANFLFPTTSGGGISVGSLPSTGNISASDFQAPVPDIPGFASGTDSAPGGLALVGENGPELVNLAKGAQVIPNNLLHAAMNMSGSARVGGSSVHQHFHLDLTNAVMTPDLVAGLQGYTDQKAATAVIAGGHYGHSMSMDAINARSRNKLR